MRYQIIIEGEATDPPPDYGKALEKIVQRETHFMLGKAWDVVQVSELVAEHPGDPEVTVWRNIHDS